MKKGLISVIMATLGKRDLTDVLATLSAQTYKDWEFIKVVDTEHKGACWARNEGTKQADGEYLFWLDDDIYLMPDCLARLARALRNDTSATWAYGAWRRGPHLIDPPEKVEMGPFRAENCVSGVALFRKDSFPGWDEALGKFQDWDVYLTLMERGHRGVKVKGLTFTTPILPDQISSLPEEQYRHWWGRVRTKHNPGTVALYTLTRDRLAYTRTCFASLWERAGYDFDHYVIDNGSTDGTVDWLRENEGRFKVLDLLTSNLGISAGSNRALDLICHSGIDYDYIGKFDNDCLLLSDSVLRELAGVIYNGAGGLVVSPKVEGLRYQPQRIETVKAHDHDLGITPILGGLFHVMLGGLYLEYIFDESLPKAQGQDQDLCKWAREERGLTLAYVEDVTVEHCESTDGQMKRYPDYFSRKVKEESGYEEAIRRRMAKGAGRQPAASASWRGPG